MKTFNGEQGLLKAAAMTVFLVAVLLLFIFVYRPAEKEVLFLENESFRMNNDITQVKGILNGKDHHPKAGSPVTKEEVTGVIHEIMRRGEENGITFITISLNEKIEDKRVKFPYQSLSIDLQSDYSALGEFLDALNNLEKGAMRVRSFDIARDETIQPSVKASLQVDIYLKGVKRGKK